MSYIIQYIRESQAKYPNISSSPVNVLKHLLYTNGNGVTFSKGNPVQEVSFYREVPFTEYYRDEKTFSDLVEFLNEYGDKEREEIYDRLKDMNKVFESCAKDSDTFKDKVKSDNDLWEDACTQFNNRYNEVDNVDNYTLDDLKNVSVLEKMINSSKYPLHLGLSDEYYKMFYLDSNTDTDLLEIAITLSKACLNILESYVDNPSIIETKRDLFMDNESGRILSAAKSDIVTLKRDIERMESLV